MKDRYHSCIIEKIPLSGGVISSPGNEIAEMKLSISDYFYGIINCWILVLGPVHTEAHLARNNTLTRNFDELQVYKFPKTTDMVDLGEEAMLDVRRVKIEELKNNTILAVTDAKS